MGLGGGAAGSGRWFVGHTSGAVVGGGPAVTERRPIYGGWHLWLETATRRGAKHTDNFTGPHCIRHLGLIYFQTLICSINISCPSRY